MTAIDILNKNLVGKKIVYYEWWIGDKLLDLYLHNRPNKADMILYNYKFVRKTTDIVKVTLPSQEKQNICLVDIAIHTNIEFEKVFNIYCDSNFEIEN